MLGVVKVAVQEELAAAVAVEEILEWFQHLEGMEASVVVAVVEEDMVMIIVVLELRVGMAVLMEEEVVVVLMIRLLLLEELREPMEEKAGTVLEIHHH